jgi:hypothetical protein
MRETEQKGNIIPLHRLGQGSKDSRMTYDRLPDAIMNEYQATTLWKFSIEAYQAKLFAWNLTAGKPPSASKT